jgi:hypothetical protein
MSSRRVETRDDVINELYNKKFGELSQDIKEIIDQKELEKLQKHIEIDLEAYKTYKLWNNINNKYQQIKADKDLRKMINFKKEDLQDWKDNVVYNYNMDGGYHTEMNIKDIKYMCKANQIKLSKVVNGTRIVYKKKSC